MIKVGYGLAIHKALVVSPTHGAKATSIRFGIELFTFRNVKFLAGSR